MLGLNCARFYSFRGARANPGKQLLHGPPAQRTGLPNSTNISGYIAQKTKSNAPDFNDAS
jgi:hypothetical protein